MHELTVRTTQIVKSIRQSTILIHPYLPTPLIIMIGGVIVIIVHNYEMSDVIVAKRIPKVQSP